MIGTPEIPVHKIQVHNEGIPKRVPVSPPPDERGKDGDFFSLPYSRIHLFLGSLIGYILAGYNDPLHKFRSYLNVSLLDGSLAKENSDPLKMTGEAIAKKAFEARKQLRQQLTKITGHPYNEIVWVTEAHFLPTGKQEEFVRELIEDRKIKKIAKDNGFSSVAALMRAMITDPELTLTLPDGQRWTAESIFAAGGIEIREYEKMPEDPPLQPDFFSGDAEKKLKMLMSYIASYYYFDFTGTKRPIKNKFSRHIALVTARPDMLGFYAKPEDGEAKEITKKLPVLLRKYLLNSAGLDPKDIKDLNTAIAMIEAGRMEMTFVEIKTLTKNDGERNNNVKKLPSEFISDVGHTLLAMFELLTRVSNIPGRDPDEHRPLLKLMHPDIAEREDALLALRPIMRNLMGKPHRYLLVKSLWPILDDPHPFWRVNLQLINDTSPALEVYEFSPRTLRRAMLERARAAFEKQELI